MAKRGIHLGWFGCAGINGDARGWQMSPPGYDWRYPEIYQDTARVCERGKFDLMVLADALAGPRIYGGSWNYHMRAGLWATMHDPVPYVAVMAAATRSIGLACTLSTTFYPPYMAARVLASLDHLSRGRIGWNIVTSAQEDAARNFGLTALMDHDVRYEAADEYVELCRKLWDSWAPDALVLDRANGIFADGTKIHAVDHQGTYFASAGPLNISRSPQGHPVIISAGSSGRGQRFAAEQSEITITEQAEPRKMRQFAMGLRDRLAESGRDRSACKIFNIVRPVLGESEDIAREKRQAIMDRITPEMRLASLSEVIGHDLSQFPLDEPLPMDLKVNAVRSRFEKLYEDGNPTLRDIAMGQTKPEGHMVCGTAHQIADQLEEAAQLGDVDGFLVAIPIQDHAALVAFVDQVVPELQRRGLTRREYSGATFRENLAGL